MQGSENRAAFHQKSAEMAIAVLFLLVSALVIYDSVKLGASWGADGPKPGYFPFYIALIMALAALVNLARAAMMPAKNDKPFVLRGQLQLVMTVLVPTAIYAGAITWIGIYAASILFIAFFMRWLGKYAWWKVALVSIGTAVVFFLVFEMWFKVPLPKGPVEAWLGLN